MTYTPQQIAELAQQLLGQGYSEQDIATGAAKYGITPEQLAGAVQQANPSLYGAGSSNLASLTSGVNSMYAPTTSVDPSRDTSATGTGTVAGPSYVAPGSSGAGLPMNYMQAPDYQSWLAKQPNMRDYMAEGNRDPSKAQSYGQALESWQTSNPYYINPKNYGTFDDYWTAFDRSTNSDNQAAMKDPYRRQSALQSYYGPAYNANLTNGSSPINLDVPQGTANFLLDTQRAARDSGGQYQDLPGLDTPRAIPTAGGNAMDSSRVQSLIRDSMGQGFSPQDIARGAYRNGISADQLGQALQAMNPSVYNAQSMPGVTSTLNQWYSGFGPQAGGGTGGGGGGTAGGGGAGGNYGGATGGGNYSGGSLYGGGTQGGGYGGEQGGSGYGSGSPGGMFSSMYGGYQASPWLSATADEIGRRTQQGLGQAFNGIRSNAVGVGGLGGSRQGVAEGVATRDAMDSLQGNLANMFAQDWTNSANRYLTGRGQDQGFTLGLGGLANQRAGQNQQYDLGLGGLQNQKYGIDTNAYLTNRGQQLNFYDSQRTGDRNDKLAGASIYDMGVKGGWYPLSTAGNIFNTTAGQNVTETSGGTKGGGWLGGLGGALSGATLGRQAGWW